MRGVFKPDEEMDYRRVLLQLAAKGDARARKELKQEYHARVYSAAQLARYSPKIKLDRRSAAIQRKFQTLLYQENESDAGYDLMDS